MSRYIVAKRRPDGRLAFHSYRPLREHPHYELLADSIWDLAPLSEALEASNQRIRLRYMEKGEFDQ